MASISRVGDSLSTGHGCTGSTTIASSNTDGSVKVDNINAIVVGAPTAPHTISPPLCPVHVANLNAGSSSVFIQGISVGRVGDSADAGAMTSGSGNVFAG
jgi:uncharacterized Zn-binding protein involved in type VI secretion